jgi:hypothetical protein
MAKTPLDTMVDMVAMLLSTDWFLPYWSVIGIEATNQKRCVQEGCREVVQQSINGAANYYLVSFSDERLEVTRQSMRALAKKCGLGESAETSFGNLVDSEPERDQFYKGAWLFRTLVDKLVKDDRLDASTRLVLERTRTEDQATDDVDFEQICEQSTSAWDNYIRSLTPEVPTSLANLLSVGLVTSGQLTRVLAQLTPMQRAGLLSRFQSTAKSVTGVDVDSAWRPL